MSVTELNFASQYAASEGVSYALTGIWLHMKGAAWWLRTRDGSGGSNVFGINTTGQINVNFLPYSGQSNLCPIIRLG